MLNHIVIQGRLGTDPEVKESRGKKYCSVPIAVQRDYKAANGSKETDWIDVCVFDKTADFLKKYFSKGDTLIAEGSLQTSTYKDKAGYSRKSYSVLANKLYFSGPNTRKEEAPTRAQFVPLDDDDGELPF